jgi:FemAB-related protein (PEP-CTERM system-associated)
MDTLPLAIDRPSRPADALAQATERVAVEPLAAGHEDEWDSYVSAAPAATFFHRAGWLGAVGSVYGHRPHHLVARAQPGGRICGVLPLFGVSGPLTGRALISTPYAVSGGPAADDPKIEVLLVHRAQQEANRLGVRYLELRKDVCGERLVQRDHYFGFRANLPSNPDEVLGRFPRKARAAARQARDQHKLTARFGHDLLPTFYRLYVVSLRRLGSPAHARRFLERLVLAFNHNCLVQVVYHGADPVAGVISFRFRDQILPYYAGIDERFNRLNISNFLYFSLMEHAVGLGLRVFDFGRTRRDNVGGCQFKINQGFEPEPMPYGFYSPGDHAIPDLRPSNAAFSRSQAIWRKLPVGMAGPLGGIVSRWLP